MCGVYEAGLTAGSEVSSTYEGRHLTFLESELFHPDHDDGLVDKGDPVVAQTSTGYIVGVAFKSAVADTDLIAIDTEGIWNLMVYADADEVWDKVASWAIVPGDALFIDRVTSGATPAITAGIGACGISKRRDRATQVPFGVALGSIDHEGEGVIAVKVHNQGSFDLVRSMCNRAVVSGGMGWSFFGRLLNGKSEGLNGYVDGTILGTPTGPTYGFGSWLCIDKLATMGANVGTPFDTGIISEADQPTANLYFAGQHQAQLSHTCGALHAWRLSSTQTIDALILAGSAGSVGFQAGKSGQSVTGVIALVTVSGAVRYVDVHDTIA